VTVLRSVNPFFSNSSAVNELIFVFLFRMHWACIWCWNCLCFAIAASLGRNAIVKRPVYRSKMSCRTRVSRLFTFQRQMNILVTIFSATVFKILLPAYQCYWRCPLPTVNDYVTVGVRLSVCLSRYLSPALGRRAVSVVAVIRGGLSQTCLWYGCRCWKGFLNVCKPTSVCTWIACCCRTVLHLKVIGHFYLRFKTYY